MRNNIAIIFAGGVGKRLNSQENNLPKQFLKINSKPIIIHTLEIFQRNKSIDKIYIAIHPDYYNHMEDLVKYYHISKIAGIVEGGATGQESIYKALKLAQSENNQDSLVLIHDGVRPNITDEVIDKNIKTALQKGNAITCTSCQETILVSENGLNPEHVPYRKHTFAAQAPQTFILSEIIDAHEITRKTNPDYTDIVDSCTLFKTLGRETYMVEGNRGNIKITTIEDLYLLRGLIRFKEDKEAFGIEGL
ncbi:MAG: 2-C-methyl-D-erythritol 4-phosphate cytidylyltransferase [Cyanobacteria bacterium SIG31]|nr:2-C-methyl-D-erythritol 4-phosphate cytidylyltransferase [Cyanobacteria bacterium SIG31]